MDSGNGSDNNDRGHSFDLNVQSVFRNINQAFAHDHEHSAHQGSTQEVVMTDVSPLHSIDAHSTVSEATVDRERTPIPETRAETSQSATSIVDVDMPLASSIPSLQSQSTHDDDEDSMPELRSVSDSDESETDTQVSFVEPRPTLLPVDDDHDSEWTDDDDDLPPLEPITGNRRARVEDDIDEARDRRHPSERRPPVGNQTFLDGFIGPLFGMNPGGENITVEHTGEGVAHPPRPQNNSETGHVHRVLPMLAAGFTFTMSLGGLPNQNQGGADVPPSGAPGNAPPGIGGREDFLHAFADFLQHMQVFGGLDDNREDPNRAKKLIAGLEPVPTGLVKRLERVGGAPGGHVDGPDDSSSPGCAICWDTLLDAESDSFKPKVPEEPAEPSTESFTSSDPLAANSQDSNSTSEPSVSQAVQIIALPCAHVFHESCLLPWFTRAKQATCPTCRFNIDPENLTHSPFPRQPLNFGAPRPAPQANDAAQAPPVPNIPASTAEEVAATPTSAGPTVAEPAATGPIPAPQPAINQALPNFLNLGQAGPRFTVSNAVPLGHGATLHFLQFPGGGNGLDFFTRRGAGPAPSTAAPENPATTMPPPSAPRSRTQSLPNMADNRAFEGPQAGDFVAAGIDVFFTDSIPAGMPLPQGQPQPQGEQQPQEQHQPQQQPQTPGQPQVIPQGPAPGERQGHGAPGEVPQEFQTFIDNLIQSAAHFMPPHFNATPAAPQGQPQATQTQEPPAGGAQTHAADGPPPPVGGATLPMPPFNIPRMHPIRPTRPMPPRRERKAWTLPSGPGPSLRERVEQKERDAGLRCCDHSCGIGPSDEEPVPDVLAASTKQISIHPLSHPTEGSVCAHTFHSACLVSAERVAGWGGEDESEPQVEVSCPVCRAVGCVTREEWEEGASYRLCE